MKVKVLHRMKNTFQETLCMFNVTCKRDCVHTVAVSENCQDEC